MKLDEINRKILEILQTNSSITNADLATKIGLAPASTLERVRKLENNGVIKGYVALVDSEKVGKGTTVFVIINMASHNSTSIKDFKKHISNLPEILECHRLAGDKDYILKIVIEDIKEYEKFSREKLALIPNIGKMNTYFSLSSPKNQTAIPIAD